MASGPLLRENGETTSIRKKLCERSRVNFIVLLKQKILLGNLLLRENAQKIGLKLFGAGNLTLVTFKRNFVVHYLASCCASQQIYEIIEAKISLSGLVLTDLCTILQQVQGIVNIW